MNNAIKILKTINKVSYLTEYESSKVSQLIIYNMERGASFTEAINIILRLRRKELQEKLRDEVSGITIDCNSTPKWQGFLSQLSENIMNGDIDNFLNWPVIAQTMFVGNAKYLDIERKYVEEKHLLVNDSKVGNPPTGGNIIHQTYHVARFMGETGQDIKDFDYILEFGAGYGCMCRVIRELGFNGDYVIFDLPHFSALQRYYLDSCNVEATCISDTKDIPRPVDCKSLSIATWSLSESPNNVRENFSGILPFFDSFLFSYQDEFGGIDNIEYFKKMKRKHRKWVDVKIEHLPGNRYLFGSKQCDLRLE